VRADNPEVNEHRNPATSGSTGQAVVPARSGDNRALCDWLVSQLDRLAARREAIETAARAGGLSEIEVAAHRRALTADYGRLQRELERGLAARGIRVAA